MICLLIGLGGQYDCKLHGLLFMLFFAILLTVVSMNPKCGLYILGFIADNQAI